MNKKLMLLIVLASGLSAVSANEIVVTPEVELETQAQEQKENEVDEFAKEADMDATAKEEAEILGS